MTRAAADARLEELEYLAMVERTGSVEVVGLRDRTPNLAMILSLVQQEFLNGIDQTSWSRHGPGEVWGAAGENAVERAFEWQRWNTVADLLGGGITRVRISHKGRVRRSELEQALLAGRDRDPFGILLDQRYVKRDLKVAILSATKESPLAVAYLDMNGLKAINDSRGHEAGDAMIRAYLQAAALVATGRGEAYRNGGDEVVVLLPSTSAEQGEAIVKSFLVQLGKEKVGGGVGLTASAGVQVTIDPETDPERLLDLADKTMLRAKEVSRKHDPRRSTLAVGGAEVETM